MRGDAGKMDHVISATGWHSRLRPPLPVQFATAPMHQLNVTSAHPFLSTGRNIRKGAPVNFRNSSSVDSSHGSNIIAVFKLL